MTRSHRLLVALFTVLFLFAAKHRAVRHPSVTPLDRPLPDVFSYSEPLRIAVRHVELDLTVDFDARVLHGSATLELNNLTGTRTLVLDTQLLTIASVTSNGAALPFTQGAEGDYGAPLTITIEPSTPSVKVEYSTHPLAPGLFWNSAAQSFGRVEPYLYSLNEPIGARSWIPIQDTPSTRVTYEATLRVPATHLALMSAGNNPRAMNATGVYSFEMAQSIPAYLIALGVGRLEYHGFDSRLGVYAEPEMIEDAAWELQYLPAMMQAAEEILGPHPFPRHDLLLMPPTFLVGGMEHPMLNFINPFSVVNGNHPAQPDPRSLIAHELAHSWSGDQTTLSTWNDVWLNEGITSYLTLRILERVSGAERADLTFFFDRQSPAMAGKLHEEVDSPGDGFGSISYLKGELFLRTLEDTFGREVIDAFLRDYFTRFSFRWVDDRNFIALLQQHVGSDGIAAAQVMNWIYTAGVPTNLGGPTSSAMYNRAQTRANSFLATGTVNPSGWPEIEKELFINLLSTTTIRDRAPALDAAFGFSFQNAPQLRFAVNAITYAPMQPAIERLLMRGGTNGAIIQLYAALASTTAGRQRAREIFAVARPRYLEFVAAQVQEILYPSAAAQPAA